MKKVLTPDERRRRNELIIIGIASLLIIIFISLAVITRKFPQAAEKIPIANNIFFFTLIFINLDLILLLIFLAVRNLVKLVFERKQKVLGSNLRTKLVLAFVIFSLVPTILLFLVSVGFVTNSMEYWFSARVEQSLQGSLEVAQTYYRDFANYTVSTAKEISQSVSKQGIRPGNLSTKQLQDQLEIRRKENHLSMLGLFFKGEKEMIRAEDSSVKLLPFQLPEDLLEIGFSGKEVSKTLPIGEGEMITGLAPIFDPSNPEKTIGVIAASYYIPKSLTTRMSEITQAFMEYKDMKDKKNPYKLLNMMVLLIVTLVIIFSATWFGFHLAKNITVPIKDLAEATVRIASGDLNVRIEMKAADEVGMLVQSFNQMTGDLQVSRSELEQRRKYMEIVLKNVAAGVISIDEMGKVTTLNTSAEEMLQVKAENVLDKNFSEVLPGEYVGEIELLMGEVRSSGRDSLEKQITVNLGGSSLSFLINLTTLHDEEKKPLGVVVVFDDLTQLIKVQRIAAWREVARRIAHEIKNPLTPIQLSAQRLRKRYLEKLQPDGEVFDECTRMIVKQVEELKGMVNEFSNFARMPASHPTPNHLNEIIEETLLLFQDGAKGVHFEFIPEKLPVLELDREQMKRALINLVKNGLAAIENGGKISIRTSYDSELKIVRLEVSDNGRGISDEDKEKLFEPYFSTRASGTGLGLTIVNSIISDHQGYIRVRDNKPKGTTFLIELPVRV